MDGMTAASVLEGGRTEAPERERPTEPLVWKRGTFRVRVAVRPYSKDFHDIEVQGPVSGYFGIFRGNSDGPSRDGHHVFSLVHTLTGRIFDTHPLRRDAMAEAAELAPLRVSWHETDPYKVVEGAPDQEKVQEIYQRYKRLRTER